MKKNCYEIIKEFATSVSNHGGQAYFVGGCVRDKIMRQDSSDFDIEVHNITENVLRDILNNIAPFSEVGKIFGIFSLNSYPIDIALPRKDIKSGNGHRGFSIQTSPDMGTYEAAKRRDFTINSIMENILTGEIVDHFNGVPDIQNSIIRHTSNETFTQDPLRLLRAAQFSARLNFKIADSTLSLCKKIDLSTLSKERVFEETRKALLLSKKPSVYFETLKKMNQLDTWFPELVLPEEKWKSTMRSIDNCAKSNEKCQSPLSFMLVALVCSFANENEVTSFIKRLTSDMSIYKYVINQFRNLTQHLTLTPTWDISLSNRMFDSSSDKEGFILLAKAIYDLSYNEEEFLKERLNLYKQATKEPFLCGKDLISEGFTPGEEFHKMLNIARDMQLCGFSKEDIILKLRQDYKLIHL